MTPTTTPTAAPAKTLQLPCPLCGEPAANVSLQLWCGDFHCEECEADFTAEDLRERMAAWSSLLAWVERMPGTPAE